MAQQTAERNDSSQSLSGEAEPARVTTEAERPNANDRLKLARALVLGGLTLVLVTIIGGVLALDRIGSGIDVELVGSEQPSTNEETATDDTDESDNDGASVVEPTCIIGEYLKNGAKGDQVTCLEQHLRFAGFFDGEPDANFDQTTAKAVKQFQLGNDLDDDGVVGPLTANKLGAWTGPDGERPADTTCPNAGRAAVVDRFNQRAWRCEDGKIIEVIPMTSATDQPAPGVYEVYEKDLEASSNLTGQYSEMTHFVAFTEGRYTGARIAFHSIPTYDDGSFVQPLESVGTPELFGDSSGCIRVLPDDAQEIWDWLEVGATVVVVS